MSEINQLTTDIITWADSVFPQRTSESALLKLFEEVGELVKDPRDPGEYADICIMIFDLAKMNGVEDLAQAIRDKLAVNKQRVWKRTLTGTLQHDESQTSARSYYNLGKHDAQIGQPKRTDLDHEAQDWYDKGYDLGVGDSD